jgi:hypothetical protein
MSCVAALASSAENSRNMISMIQPTELLLRVEQEIYTQKPNCE